MDHEIAYIATMVTREGLDLPPGVNSNMEGGGTYLIRKHEATFLQLKANAAKTFADESRNASSFNMTENK